mmetsp:Transcript_35684/g.114132  ORF Transcript_35684/g.114132 Transcript_35684/m.114132 type:complete len:249 (+) Transcript_35684:1433-2179(+)
MFRKSSLASFPETIPEHSSLVGRSVSGDFLDQERGRLLGRPLPLLAFDARAASFEAVNGVFLALDAVEHAAVEALGLLGHHDLREVGVVLGSLFLFFLPCFGLLVAFVRGREVFDYVVSFLVVAVVAVFLVVAVGRVLLFLSLVCSSFVGVREMCVELVEGGALFVEFLLVGGYVVVVGHEGREVRREDGAGGVPGDGEEAVVVEAVDEPLGLDLLRRDDGRGYQGPVRDEVGRVVLVDHRAAAGLGD